VTASAATAVNPRTQALLQAPLIPTLLKLAAPNVLGLLATTVTIAYDGWVVGRLGADALAGVALVFPLAMLMVQMSGGGIGGATTAAVARALGAGQRAQAETLLVQALWVAISFALLFMVVLLPFGPALYAAFGGRGAALQAAQAYGGVLFSGALVVWVTNVVAGAVRGSGQMALASALLVASAALHLVLCPLLVFGFGSWRGLGVAGAAASTLVSNALAGRLDATATAACGARPAPDLDVVGGACRSAPGWPSRPWPGCARSPRPAPRGAAAATAPARRAARC
jgi:Na+-driven multidrug efflux pump